MQKAINKGYVNKAISNIEMFVNELIRLAREN